VNMISGLQIIGNSQDLIIHIETSSEDDSL
jgi:hypothetical protein